MHADLIRLKRMCFDGIAKILKELKTETFGFNYDTTDGRVEAMRIMSWIIAVITLSQRSSSFGAPVPPKLFSGTWVRPFTLSDTAST